MTTLIVDMHDRFRSEFQEIVRVVAEELSSGALVKADAARSMDALIIRLATLPATSVPLENLARNVEAFLFGKERMMLGVSYAYLQGVSLLNQRPLQHKV